MLKQHEVMPTVSPSGSNAGGVNAAAQLAKSRSDALLGNIDALLEKKAPEPTTVDSLTHAEELRIIAAIMSSFLGRSARIDRSCEC